MSAWGSMARTALGKRRWEWAVFGLYLAVVIAGAFRHEMWRDEVRALSLAAHSPNWSLLFASLHVDGHPVLWYALLRLAFQVFQTPFVLPVLSALIAAAAVGLFLFRAPFPLWQRAAFAFGVLPVYEYSIMCRNYGISMLALFGLAAAFSAGSVRPWLVGLLLFWLALTNLPGLLVVLAVLAAIGFAGIRRIRSGEPIGWGWAAAWLAGALGAAWSFWQIWPSPDSSIFHGGRLGLAALGRDFLAVVKAPGAWFHEALVLPEPGGTIVVWAAGLYFLRRPVLFIVYLGTLFGLGVEFTAIYPGALRHQGVGLLTWVCLAWLDRVWPAEPRPWLPRRLQTWLGLYAQRTMAVVFSLILVLQIAHGARHYGLDWLHPMSASKAFGRFLKTHPEYSSAILVGEPDYRLESLPYYAPNRIFMVRENRYGRITSFTRDSKQSLSLTDWLAGAQRVQRLTTGPVLLVFGHAVTGAGPWRLDFGYGSTFLADPGQWKDFEERTVLVRRFEGALTDENYTVYRLR